MAGGFECFSTGSCECPRLLEGRENHCLRRSARYVSLALGPNVVESRAPSAALRQSVAQVPVTVLGKMMPSADLTVLVLEPPTAGGVARALPRTNAGGRCDATHFVAHLSTVVQLVPGGLDGVGDNFHEIRADAEPAAWAYVGEVTLPPPTDVAVAHLRYLFAVLPLATSDQCMEITFIYVAPNEDVEVNKTAALILCDPDVLQLPESLTRSVGSEDEARQLL